MFIVDWVVVHLILDRCGSEIGFIKADETNG